MLVQNLNKGTSGEWQQAAMNAGLLFTASQMKELAQQLPFVVPRARVANTDVRRSSFATEIESRRRVVVSRATTGRPTSSRRRSRSERIHARRPRNTYVSLPLCTECPIFSLSLSFTTPRPLATRREDEKKTKRKKNEKKRHRRNKTKRTKTLGVE